MNAAIIQTWALAVDAYRELNSRKLFWITMLLSGVFVVLFAAMGITNRGITLFTWTLDFIPVNRTWLSPQVFYKLLFSNLGIAIWLTWIANILALMSTAGIVPDLIASGAIETTLSKPISRIRLLLTKYMFGLLFVALQVLVISSGSFVVFGVRAGLWEPRLFLAVPLVMLVFSYLFSVCVLVGMITRSTIAALLITLLFWGALFVVNSADSVLLSIREQNGYVVEQRASRITRMVASTTQLLRDQRAASGEDVGEAWSPTDAELEAANPFLRDVRERQAESLNTVEELNFWTGVVVKAKTVLPKTSETTALLERWLIDLSELPERPDQDAQDFQVEDEDVSIDERAVRRRIEATLRERSVWWVLGTSIGFEAVVLGIAAFIFVRRDF